jgi:hypothetical protein
MTPMIKSFRNPLLLGAAAMLGLSMTAPVFSPAEAQARLILRCSAVGPRDISMATRYEVRPPRRKFTVEMEAAPNSGFRAGQRITFVVAGRVVGSDTLQRVVGGDLVGELNLDTQAGPNDPDEDPFPRNFPPVGKGTGVLIKAGARTVLGCALR